MSARFNQKHPFSSCTVEEFVALWKELGSPVLVAQRLGIGVRKVYERRNNIQSKLGIDLRTWNDTSDRQIKIVKHQGKIEQNIENGTVIVFSDAHYWPDVVTTAHRALIAMIKQMKPVAVVCNGDAFDGASISRFPRPFFDEAKPTVQQELEACKERLGEIEKASEFSNLIWTLGNHDLRFEARLAAQAPQYEGVTGMHLKDHFPMWKPAWSYWVNDCVEVRHRHRSGIHATHNNVMANHHSMITGHLHALQVKPYTDGRGIVKYGVDTGTLADIDGQQFVDYLEGRTPAWRSGFVVLTWKDGEMLFPELVMKHDEDHVQFRGHVLDADTLEIV